MPYVDLKVRVWFEGEPTVDDKKAVAENIGGAILQRKLNDGLTENDYGEAGVGQIEVFLDNALVFTT